jgi:hypothetical protein
VITGIRIAPSRLASTAILAIDFKECMYWFSLKWKTARESHSSLLILGQLKQVLPKHWRGADLVEPVCRPSVTAIRQRHSPNSMNFNGVTRQPMPARADAEPPQPNGAANPPTVAQRVMWGTGTERENSAGYERLRRASPRQPVCSLSSPSGTPL